MTVDYQRGTTYIGADIEFEFTITDGDATTMDLVAYLTTEWGGSLFATYTEGDGITVDDADTVRVAIAAADSANLSRTDYVLALWNIASGSTAPLGIATIDVMDGGKPR